MTPALIDAADKEGSVDYYVGTWTTSTAALVKSFNSYYPAIKVNVYSAGDALLQQKLLAEQKAGKPVADVFTGTDPSNLNKLANQKLFANNVVPNADLFAANTEDAGYWYPLRLAMVGVAWNTTNVSDADAAILSTWQGLTDPRWAGKGGVVNPSGGGIGYLPWYMWDTLYGDSFIQAIGKNKPRVFSGINPAASALASGDISVLFNASETGLVPLLQKGAPIKWSIPTPAVGPATGQAVLATAPHPNAAKLFQDFTFSNTGYTTWQSQTGISAMKGVGEQRKELQSAAWYKIPAVSGIYSFDSAKSSAAQAHILSLFNSSVA